jgi:hypothetical protein
MGRVSKFAKALALGVLGSAVLHTVRRRSVYKPDVLQHYPIEEMQALGLGKYIIQRGNGGYRSRGRRSRRRKYLRFAPQVRQLGRRLGKYAINKSLF